MIKPLEYQWMFDYKLAMEKAFIRAPELFDGSYLKMTKSKSWLADHVPSTHHKHAVAVYGLAHRRNDGWSYSEEQGEYINIPPEAKRLLRPIDYETQDKVEKYLADYKAKQWASKLGEVTSVSSGMTYDAYQIVRRFMETYEDTHPGFFFPDKYLSNLLKSCAIWSGDVAAVIRTFELFIAGVTTEIIKIAVVDSVNDIEDVDNFLPRLADTVDIKLSEYVDERYQFIDGSVQLQQPIAAEMYAIENGDQIANA
jgi:hypothetical protein